MKSVIKNFREHTAVMFLVVEIIVLVGAMGYLFIPAIQREMHPTYEESIIEVVDANWGANPLMGELMLVRNEDGTTNIWTKNNTKVMDGDIFYVSRRNGDMQKLEKLGNSEDIIVVTTEIIGIDNNVAYIKYKGNTYGYYFDGDVVKGTTIIAVFNKDMEIINAL